MELRVLGPVELLIDGQPMYLARRQQRLLLGILAMEANRLVSRDRLIDLVWSSKPPKQAKAVLQTRVSEIRSALNRRIDSSQILVTRDGGYLLNIAPDVVDLHRFQSLVREARHASSDEDVRRLLRTASELWRGPVLGGWLPSESRESLCGSVEEARLTANEDLWDVELRLGHYLAVVDDVTQAAARSPCRERLVGLAMTALHRSGRTAEALQCFDRSRRWLASELGVDPSANLRRLHVAMLGGRPVAWPGAPGATKFAPAVPHLLPAVTPDFTGREVEAAQTRALLTAERSALRLVVITGPAGVGKTALSVRVAHQILDRFPDGQLYADLHGPGRLNSPDTADVLACFLRALGVAHLPDGIDERAALYRNLLAGREILVVLDNAHDADPVRTLTPGSSSCAVLITSRTRLGATIGATSIEINVLAESSAVDLLSVIVGRECIEREPAAAKAIVRLCGGLPLAVRAVAARLNAKPHWALSELQKRLVDERKRLDHLTYGDLDVRASILSSFAGLSPQANSLLRRLGDTGMTDVDQWFSAALLETDTCDAEEILEELHDAQLLDANSTIAIDGYHRYRLPDLVRLVAAEQAANE
jgi:DNA-binding SARP family transcriptional activator/predicted ATPase